MPMTTGEGPGPGSFLILGWQSGGGTQPMFGLGRLLAGRGHSVRVLGPRPHRTRIEAAGCEWRPFPTELEFDPAKGRSLEEQEEFVVRMNTGIEIANALLAEVDRDRPDVLIVDHQLRSAISATELTGLRTVALVHTAFGFHGSWTAPEAGWDLEPTNETRKFLGLPAIPRSEDRLSIQLQARCDRALSVMPPEFDPPADRLPNLVHVGPIFEEDPAPAWDPPWPADDARPLVVVSMSSQYMSQEPALGRVIRALEGLPVRALVLTGLELAPREVETGPHIVVRGYVPHVAVMPHARVVVTHGGMGTIMAAFAFGVPLLCMPLGRDQPVNAARVEALGAGRTIPSDAPDEAVRAAILEVLGSDALRASARRMAEIVTSYESGAPAFRELERVLLNSRSATRGGNTW